MMRIHLDHQMRVVLAKLELVSNGTTISYNNSGGGRGENPDPRPRGGDAPAHLHWARQYGAPFVLPTPRHPGASDDDERQRVIEAATEDHQQLTGHGLADKPRPAGETAEQRNQRICEEGEGWTIKEAAAKFRCGERDIRRARIDAGLDPTLGLSPIGLLPTYQRRQRSAELRASGHSVAAIALLLKVSKETIKRDLRYAKAA